MSYYSIARGTFFENLKRAHSHDACRAECILLTGKVDIDHFFDTSEVVFLVTIGGGRESSTHFSALI